MGNLQGQKKTKGKHGHDAQGEFVCTHLCVLLVNVLDIFALVVVFPLETALLIMYSLDNEIRQVIGKNSLLGNAIQL